MPSKRAPSPGHAHDHGHSHGAHDHGHSHRTGAATLYWRDPKAISVTIACFLGLVLLVALGSSRGATEDAMKKSPNGPLIAWICGERYGVIEQPGMVVMPLPASKDWCSPLVDVVACATPSCIAAFAWRSDITLVADADALTSLATVDGAMAAHVLNTAQVFTRDGKSGGKFKELNRRCSVAEPPAVQGALTIACDCDDASLLAAPKLASLPRLVSARHAKEFKAVVYMRDYADGSRLASVENTGAMILLPRQTPEHWVKATSEMLSSLASPSQFLGFDAESEDLESDAFQAKLSKQRAVFAQECSKANGPVDLVWSGIFKRATQDRSSRGHFNRSQCVPSGIRVSFARVVGEDLRSPSSGQKCSDLLPSQRQCDDVCPGSNFAYRADLGGCVTGSACSLPTFEACMDSAYATTCPECMSSSFGHHVLVERLVRSTMAVSNLTLFLLGGLLGLIFAKVNWVNPLLQKYEGGAWGVF